MEKSNYNEFVVLLTRSQRQMRWFLTTLLPSQSDVDDVMQETSLVLWNKWDTFRRDGDFLKWGLGVARRQALSYLRQRSAGGHQLDDAVLGLIAEAAERKAWDAALLDERSAALRQCLKHLGEREREVVEWRYLHEKPPKDIGNSLGKPLSTIYSMLDRARAQLTDCLRRSLAEKEQPV